MDSNDKLFSEVYKVADIKEKKGDIVVPLKNEKGESGGSISMKYTAKNLKS